MEDLKLYFERFRVLFAKNSVQKDQILINQGLVLNFEKVKGLFGKSTKADQISS